MTPLRTVRTAIAAALVLGLGLAVGARSAPDPGPQAVAAPPDRTAERAARRTPVVDVFENARDAVVNIAATEIVTVRSRSPFNSFFDDYFDMPRRPRVRQQRRQSVGSGFIIHAAGYIVTNAHVVARTAERRAIFADGREYDARIVAVDEGRDLAVLKIDADGPLPTLPLGRSDDLMIGETVIAIGNPLGFQHTVTAGVVSAVGRDIAISPEITFEDLIQTDASINPGNSGGPLLNVLGQLIGINSAIRGDAQNIGFAIPVDQLRAVLPALLDVERRYRIDSGLVVDSVNAPRVLAVRPESPADEAGLEVGDQLLEINGRPVHEGIDYDIALIERRRGDRLDLRVRRGTRVFPVQVRLLERPAPDGRALAATRLGLRVERLPQDEARRQGFERVPLVVRGIDPGSPADRAGVEAGDVLLALGRRYIDDLDELGQLLEAVDAGSALSVRVLRREGRRRVVREGPIEVQ